MSFDLKSYALGRLKDSQSSFANDLFALEEADLLVSPLGSARPPVDFIYEVVFINRRLAARIRGEALEPFARGEGWMVAPAEFRAKDVMVAEFHASMDEITTSLEAADIETKVTFPDGSQQTVGEVALFATIHVTYHDGQLNYLQSMKGDDAVHWD